MTNIKGRLGAGLEAYAHLRGAFDPNASAIGELKRANVAQRRIEALYPLDFAAYLPQLQHLVDDWALTKQIVEASYAGGKLSASRLELCGVQFAELDTFHAEFTDPTSHTMDSLFESTLLAYTEDLSWMPMPAADRTEMDQAHAEVGYLMVNLALSAWLLANWQRVCEIKSNDMWLSPSLRTDVLDVTLSFFKRVWTPIIDRYISG